MCSQRRNRSSASTVQRRQRSVLHRNVPSRSDRQPPLPPTPSDRLLLKAWAFRGLGLVLVQRDDGLAGEVWDRDRLEVIVVFGTVSEASAIRRLEQRAASLRPSLKLDTAPFSRRQRQLIDSAGQSWVVTEGISAQWNWAQGAAGLRDRALLFESDHAHCRLANYPRNWDELSDAELEALIGRAECTWRRRGTPDAV